VSLHPWHATGIAEPPPDDHCGVPSALPTLVPQAKGESVVLIVIALLVVILFSAAIMSARLGY
jgi:hypothetical protein